MVARTRFEQSEKELAGKADYKRATAERRAALEAGARAAGASVAVPHAPRGDGGVSPPDAPAPRSRGRERGRGRGRAQRAGKVRGGGGEEGGGAAADREGAGEEGAPPSATATETDNDDDGGGDGDDYDDADAPDDADVAGGGEVPEVSLVALVARTRKPNPKYFQ